jgi:prepilin-type N-terminal cleavage/methylation domain-containing protein
MKITRTNISLGGFTLLEIMIVVGIIGLLAAIAIPNFMNARANSQANSCINNLRQIDTAIQQVAFEQNKHVGDTLAYPDDITPYIKLNATLQIPPCPAGGNYILNPVGSTHSVVCSLGNTVTPAHLY